jgi:hypothetical protein
MKTMKAKLALNIKIPNNSVTEEARIPNINSVKAECHHIIDEIYLSGYQVGNDYEFLRKNNFTHIINCASSSKSFTPVFYEDFSYLLLDIKDEPGFDIMYYIYLCIDFIENAGKTNSHRKILIHCYEGVSRAPTILSSYLIWKYNFEKDYVIKLLKEKRKCVDINLGFLYQLERWNENRICQFNNDKFIKIEKCGNITLIDKTSLSDQEKANICNLLFKNERTLVNIVLDGEARDTGLVSKLQNLIYLLQTYENFPMTLKNMNYEETQVCY